MKKNLKILIAIFCLFIIMYLLIPGVINYINPLSKPIAVSIAKDYLESNYDIEVRKKGKIKSYFLEPGYFQIEFNLIGFKDINFIVNVSHKDLSIINDTYYESVFNYVFHKELDKVIAEAIEGDVDIKLDYKWDYNSDIRLPKNNVSDINLRDFKQYVKNITIRIFVNNTKKTYLQFDYEKLYEFINNCNNSFGDMDNRINIHLYDSVNASGKTINIPIEKVKSKDALIDLLEAE